MPCLDKFNCLACFSTCLANGRFRRPFERALFIRSQRLYSRGLGKFDRMLTEQIRVQLRRRIREGRQFVERLQTEVVEKLPRRRVQCRTARHITMADHLDPAAILELLDDLRIHRDAANLFDIAARDRLPVRNDRERLEHRARIFRRLLRMQTIQVRAHRGLALKSPARRQPDQLHTAPRPILLQVFEQIPNSVCRHAVGKELAQIDEL